MKNILLLLVGIFLMLGVAGCGGSSEPSTVNGGSLTGLDKIAAYADNNSNPAPTVQDYADAGVTGVSAGNLTDVNAAVDAVTKTGADSVAEVQALVDGVALLKVTNLTPADDATNADAENDLVMTFNKFITKVTGKHFQIFKSDGDVIHTDYDVGVAQVNINGNKVTVNPNSHLVYGAAHYVKIDAGAFKDALNNDYSGISDTTTWNFSVPSGSGPCGLDCVDNCDLPASLQ